MSDAVLVTGGFGLVGSQTVRRLAELGRRVVATDLGTDATRKAAASLPGGAEARWADLTDAAQVDQLLTEVAPAAIIHLAAVIPPPIYRNPKVARKVNVDATATLVRAAEALPQPPRFVQASSNAVYGARNPHRHTGPVTADTPPTPTELYGGHKLEAEEIVRASSLQWVVLRLGGVLSVDPKAMPLTTDALFFESALPTDGRLHSVDVRDVAWAFAAATTADVVGEILLIAGDDTHKIRQGEVGAALAGARGLAGALPPGRPGDPDRDDAWFITDWMDTARAQEALQFQHHSWPDMIAEMRAQVGVLRYPIQLLAPLARIFVARQSAYRNMPGKYADPWAAIRSRLGEPGLDRNG
ncbi:oxidoreductase [Mycobacterium sp. IS-1742]|uniref:NAD-dependent epimerase/dehydratase family protein n=1 Tax=Mycobacterium sp. IS-1742 TaxID=1772285 RepID=UPI00073FB032|nr:NAD(P)-dependent oxidoreductase [Mycobacterium sp. IS-1742]KUI27046.1 oxidoreductase [Mycobacterium sp. IS-1742]